MILTGKQIEKEVLSGNIVIENFSLDKLNPNSYNLTLGDFISEYDLSDGPLSMKKKPRLITYRIPKDGICLLPGKFYLASTAEYTETHSYVPRIQGRSSVGRYGVSIHCTNDFGDVGYCGNWTLCMSAIIPIYIFSGVPICQIYYEAVYGEITKYDSKYQGSTGIVESMLYKDFE